VTAGSRYCAGCGADTRAVQAEVDTLDLNEGRGPRRIPRDDELLGLLRAATRHEHEILGELGSGGMAKVFLARELALDRKVAIKVLLPALLYGDGMVERFKREARTAGGLSHPHIIPIHAVRETPDLLYFVMKYVEGRPLDTVLKEIGPLPIRMVQTILTQVASALHTAHRRQVVHRDIKSANIMLDEEGYAVVTDFGIAKVNAQANLTQTGSAVGTPYYMSPEQFTGQGVGPASDQYSLGVVGYEMLAGQVPFPARSIQEVMRAHLVDAPPPILPRRPDCPPALERAVLRMLAKDWEDRFPSMDDVVHAIGTIPLDSADAVRTQITELARSGKQRRYQPVPALAGPRTPSGARPAPGTPARRRSSRHSLGAPGLPPRPPTGPELPTPARRSAGSRPMPTGILPPTLSRPLRLTLLGAGGLAAVAAGWFLVALTSTRALGPSEARVVVASSYADARLVVNGRDTVPLGPDAREIRVPAGSLELTVIRSGCRALTVRRSVRAGTVETVGRLDPTCR